MRDHAEACLQKWAPPFGFGHYTVLVRDASKKEAKKGWAHVTWNVEEEWLLVALGDVDRLTPEQVEHVIVHELAHVLQAFGRQADACEEMVCNRIAGLLVGAEYGVRGLSGLASAARYFDDEERDALLDVMPHLLVRMPERHRNVLIAIFYDGKSLGEIAREVGVERSTIMRRRDRALEALRALFVEGRTDG